MNREFGRRVEKLSVEHDLSQFDCGQPALNDWLRDYALQNQRASAAQTYVGMDEGKVAGFYSLAAGHVLRDHAPERVSKGLAKHPIPVVLLARLAVDIQWQGRGVGRSLLKDAIMRTLQAAEIAGVRALVVHAKDERARAFYEHFELIASSSDPLHLFALIKDLRKQV